jgi:hypothetical protein
MEPTTRGARKTPDGAPRDRGLLDEIARPSPPAGQQVARLLQNAPLELARTPLTMELATYPPVEAAPWSARRMS